MEPFSTQGNLNLLKEQDLLMLQLFLIYASKAFLQLNNMNKDLLNEFLKIDLHQRINLSVMKTPKNYRERRFIWGYFKVKKLGSSKRYGIKIQNWFISQILSWNV